MSIEGRYRRADGMLTTIEIVAIPGERRYVLLKAIRIVNATARPVETEEATIAIRVTDSPLGWKMGEYRLKLMFRGNQLVVIESGAGSTYGMSVPIDGLYQKAGVVVR